MKKYKQYKSKAKNYIIDYCINLIGKNLSYGELWEIQQHILVIAKQYGLIKFCKEEGIL